MRGSRRSLLLAAAVISALFLFTGCLSSTKLSGTYRNVDDKNTYLEFGEGHRVTYKNGSVSVTGTYVVSDIDFKKYVTISMPENVDWKVLGQESKSEIMIFSLKGKKSLNVDIDTLGIDEVVFKKYGFWQKHWLKVVIIWLVLGTILSIIEKKTGRDIDEIMDEAGEKIEGKIDDFVDKM